MLICLIKFPHSFYWEGFGIRNTKQEPEETADVQLQYREEKRGVKGGNQVQAPPPLELHPSEMSNNLSLDLAFLTPGL